MYYFFGFSIIFFYFILFFHFLFYDALLTRKDLIKFQNFLFAAMLLSVMLELVELSSYELVDESHGSR